MSLDAIIFDFDGVIADTEPLHYQTFRGIINRQNMDCSWEEYRSQYIGYDDRDLFRQWFLRHDRPLSEEGVRTYIDQKAIRFSHAVEAMNIMPYPGVVELIHQMDEAGILLGLCSGALQSDVLPVLDKFDLAEFFAVVSTAEDVSVSKPDPMPYRHCLDALMAVSGRDLIPACCVAIEDTPPGIASATSAGLMTIGVTNTYPKEQLDEATVVLDSLKNVSWEQFIDLLEKEIKADERYESKK